MLALFGIFSAVQAAVFNHLELEEGLVPDLEAGPCNKRAMAKLFKATIPNFGKNCTSWAKLFTEDGSYYHAHAGFHEGDTLEAACTGYAGFCPPGKKKCSFQISGKPLIRGNAKKCYALVPYLWSETPASAANLEPHNGWEYMEVVRNTSTPVGWSIQRFSEIETTFSVPYNWANASDASGEKWKVNAFQKYSQAQKGECNNPIQPFLASFFKSKSKGGNLYRQQGDAVALAAGGICQAVVPYAALVNGKMQEGKFVFTMSKQTSNGGEQTYGAVEGKALAVKFISFRE